MAYKTAPEMFGDGGGFGPVVPYSTSNPPGTSAGNRGIQFGEQLTAAIANRTHYALALNTDDLNTRLATFEAGGLDAAYANGAIGPRGGGREITKDGGAVETVSALAAQYVDDISNAHFRANAFGDTAKGGGYDFRAQLAVNGYGYLSRTTFSPSVSYTAIGASAAVTMNPGGAGADIARFGANVRDVSGNTDVGYQASDFLEITGTPFDGLYVIWSGGPATTDWRIRRLDGSVPGFAANQAGTARFFTADMVTSSRAWLGAGAPFVASGTSSDDSAILAASRDLEGKSGVGSVYGLSFGGRSPDGQLLIPTRITGLGRTKSDLSADTFFGTPFAREIDWAEGGIPFIRLLKNSAPAGYHEIGLLMEDSRTTFVDGQSWFCVEYRHPIIESTFLGLNASINGTYAAPMGKIILPDSDGAPAPPAGQFHSLWAQAVQPGTTVVRVLTGVGSGRDYLVSSITTDSSAPLTQDFITVTHLDGSALDPLELPTVGALTFQFLLRGTIGGRSHPLTIDTAAPGITAPADVSPANLFHSTFTAPGADPSGARAAVFRGGISGLVPAAPGLAPGPYTLHGHIPWEISGDGDFATDGGVQAADYIANSAGDYAYGYTNDTDYYVSLITGISQTDGAGDVPGWYFDYTTGEWVCVDVTKQRLWFPLQFKGQLRSVVWVSKNFAVGPLMDLGLITETQSEVGPYGKTVTASGTTSNGFGTAVQRNTVNFNTNIAHAASAYYLRVQAGANGDRLRSLKVKIRRSFAGDGW